MPNGRRESYEAVPRRPEQQGTEGPALSKNSMFSVHLLPCLLLQATCLPVYSSTCQLTTLPYLNHTLSLSQPSVTPRTCSSVTMSFSYHVLSQPSVTHRTCSSVTLSFSYHVLSQLSVTPRTCSSVTLSFSYPVPLSTLPYPYPVTKKVKPYSFTFFFFPLLSLLIRSRAVTTKTYFVCPP